MTVLVLMNKDAGRVLDEGADAVEADIRAVLTAAGKEARFVLGEVPVLLEALDQAKEEAVVTVGGDGTIGAVASVLAAKEDPPRFVPLPFGTANLFTRDLGLPLDPMEALEAGIEAKARRIDYACAGEHPLLHSAVFGTFAEIAEDREVLRTAEDLGERVAAAASAAGKFLAAEPVSYHITIDGEPLDAITNVVFVTNNAITGGERGVPQRARLDAGELVVYVASSENAASFMRTLLEAVSGGFDESHGVIEHVCSHATVTANGAPLCYAADGEVVEGETEVVFTIRPGALSVPDLRATG